jgi:hypothetical protein
MVKQSNIGEIDLKAAKLRAKTDEFSYARMPIFKKVVFNDSTIDFYLSDKSIVTIPLSWSKILLNASKQQREDYKIRTHFIYWYGINETLGVENLLNGSIVPKKPNKVTILAIKASKEGKVTKTKNVAHLMRKLKS